MTPPFMVYFPFYEQDWYQSCISDCAAILTEKGEESKIAILELHYLIGKRVLEDSLHWERAAYGEKIIENLASDIFLQIQNKKSAARRLWECIRFVRQYPELESATGGGIDVMKLPAVEGMRTPGWKYIKEHLLPAPKACEHEWKEEQIVSIRCNLCGKKR